MRIVRLSSDGVSESSRAFVNNYEAPQVNLYLKEAVTMLTIHLDCRGENSCLILLVGITQQHRGLIFVRNHRGNVIFNEERRTSTCVEIM